MKALLPLLAALACTPAPPVDPVARRAARIAALKTELGPAWDQPAPGVDGADANLGGEVYGKSCAACHGERADGHGLRSASMRPPPANLRGGADLTEAGRMQVIRKGSPGTAMPGFEGRLSEEHILAVGAWLRDLR